MPHLSRCVRLFLELAMELKTVKIDKPSDLNFILGQSHFIKTVEDLYEAIVQTVPGMKFGIGFCESSGPALVRFAGNDTRLAELAQKNALELACGHCFIIFMESGFPLKNNETMPAYQLQGVLLGEFRSEEHTSELQSLAYL